ncbi:MAG: WYL domain-containing protein [Glaciimonas sp.]|nr:WYL domain-containing protein [Glaciimonas sp.]
METLLRQLAMLRLLPRYPRKIDTRSLHDELNRLGYVVTLRTIQRDLNNLSTALPLANDQQSKPQGWWWHADADPLEIPGLDPQSALVFKMAEQHLKQALPAATLESLRPWFKAANGVLEKQTDKVGSWMDKVRIIPRGQPLLPPNIDANVQAIVYQAVFESRRLAISYTPRGVPTSKEYEINPIALVQRDHLIYIVCTLRDYGNPVLLLMHRIRTAGLLDIPSRCPEGFDLDSYIAQGELGYRVGPPIKLIADFESSAAVIFFETPLSKDQTLRELSNGMIRLTATVPDTKELRAWLRGFGRDVSIVEPGNRFLED